MSSPFDVAVVGSGPNGLVAAITMARAGRRVVVFEAASTPGGGCRTAELTFPGFRHDFCSTVHALAAASPALRALRLEDHGVRWLHPAVPLAHPLDGGAAVLHRSVDDTVAGLGADGPVWRRLVRPFVDGGLGVVDDVLSPRDTPRHPVRLARFASAGVRGAEQVGRRFATEQGRALLAGLAAHSVLPLDRPLTAGVGVVLASLAHLVGWPFAEGGSQSIVDALVAILLAEGGEVACDHRIDDLARVPAAVVLADVAPGALAAMAGGRGHGRFRHGPGVCKVDFALSEAVPWTDPAVAGAGTVHLGGTMAEIATAEASVWRGEHPERPFVLVAQPSACDPTRAPPGRHTLWTYCHVPAGSDVDMSAAIEAQIARFAPGFADVVLASHVTTARAYEAYNANLVGGDVTGGVTDWRQFVRRPTLARRPWRTPIEGVYLCSASTPPGGGVHGMCGWHAARTALRDLDR